MKCATALPRLANEGESGDDPSARYRDYLDRAHERVDRWIERVYNPWVDRCRRLPEDAWPPRPWPAPLPTPKEFAAELGISMGELGRLVAADPLLREALEERVARCEEARALLGSLTKGERRARGLGPEGRCGEAY